MGKTILFVDDENTIRVFMSKNLRRDGYDVLEADTLAAAREQLAKNWVDIVILDRRLPDGEGLSLLKDINKSDPYLPVIILTAYGNIDNAVEAMKNGAYDYLTKPVDLEALRARLTRVAETVNLRRELDHWRKRSHVLDSDWIIGSSAAMRRIAADVEQVAPTKATVLITGESGTGKEVLARAIQSRSKRRDKPFRPINCAALPDHLLENELFGHEPNAFSGAGKQKKGLFEVADGGTVFLDEISAMKPDMQAKLLRIIQERTVRRLGGVIDISVDIRLVAATNQNLQAAMDQGLFREDLYFRLSVVCIHLPPLRERAMDIPLFVASFLDFFNRELGKNIGGARPEVMEAFKLYHWPGNIRELRNVIERAAVFCNDDRIQLSHLPHELVSGLEG
ncbi:MAG: sigma-54-dependent Fis family transcriptional regulator [Anaerolineales bacterium]|nr:sigma-54-dependent Fis family transcriptional regulator [Anaerolineales bacterium]